MFLCYCHEKREQACVSSTFFESSPSSAQPLPAATHQANRITTPPTDTTRFSILVTNHSYLDRPACHPGTGQIGSLETPTDLSATSRSRTGLPLAPDHESPDRRPYLYQGFGTQDARRDLHISRVHAPSTPPRTLSTTHRPHGEGPLAFPPRGKSQPSLST